MCLSAVRPHSPLTRSQREQQELILSPNRRLDRMCHRQVSPFRISAAARAPVWAAAILIIEHRPARLHTAEGTPCDQERSLRATIARAD